MIQLIPFQVDDLKLLPVQPLHVEALAQVLTLDRATLKHRLENQWSWTAWDDEIPVAACGIMPHGEAWAFLAADLTHNMVAITRAVRSVLDGRAKAVGPVTATTLLNFPPADRWVRMLGFVKQPDGHWKFE